MSELWSQFQDLLTARDELNIAMWGIYGQADMDTRLKMSGYLTGPEWQAHKDMEKMRAGIHQAILELEA